MKELNDEELQGIDGGNGASRTRYVKITSTGLYDDNKKKIGTLKKGDQVEVVIFSAHKKSASVVVNNYKLGKEQIDATKVKVVKAADATLKDKVGYVKYTAIDSQLTPPTK